MTEVYYKTIFVPSLIRGVLNGRRVGISPPPEMTFFYSVRTPLPNSGLCPRGTLLVIHDTKIVDMLIADAFSRCRKPLQKNNFAKECELFKTHACVQCMLI